jgi:serine/threonine protein kinase
MEYCIGGDFLGLLIRKNTLSEEITRWYIAEMILGVEEAHRMRWIHRDVKPDNFLISVDGHLKISDFGLAFDGEWCHDQKFHQKNRHSLMEQLGLEVVGDSQDLQEKEGAEVMKQDMNGTPISSPEKRHAHGLERSACQDEPAIGEPLLDWRNRSQRRRLARSVVGTSQYMAPEVIRGDMYDGRCD